MTEARFVELVASDGHRLDAFTAGESGPGLVVVPEIFGLNGHIRDVVTRFASGGFRVVAPALFDRIEKNVELDYDEAGTARGRELRTKLGWDAPLLDVGAAITHLGSEAKVGVLGYCWGGSIAFLAGCRAAPSALACAVGYYGGQIAQHLGEHPRVPTLLHFGEKDPLISAEDVAKIRAANPGVEIVVHPAGHGFNCDRRGDYDAESAARALERTLAFFAEHLA